MGGDSDESCAASMVRQLLVEAGGGRGGRVGTTTDLLRGRMNGEPGISFVVVNEVLVLL